jgi:hypothetical protein
MFGRHLPELFKRKEDGRKKGERKNAISEK